MLVLSRRRGERIMIGDNIIVTFIDTKGDKARIGVDAPDDVSVHRQEVFDAIRREKRVDPSSQAPPSDQP